MTIEEDGKTVTLAESGAICEFIIERYGQGKLAVAPNEGGILDRADYLYWMHYAEVSPSVGSHLAALIRDAVLTFAYRPTGNNHDSTSHGDCIHTAA